MSIIITGPAEDYPSAMAVRLAGYGYRPDTIHAALINSFGRSIPRPKLMELTLGARRRRARVAVITPRAGLMAEDAKYRDCMEMANAKFVAALHKEMAA